MNVENGTVGLAEAKVHFSELMAAVEAGATIEITRRGKAIATVSPAQPSPGPRSIDLASLQRMADAMPFGEVECGEFVLRMRDAGRY